MMEALILNTNFEVLAVFDVFKSFIWTERYDKYGDFEIYTPMDSNILSALKEDYYIWLKESEYTMIIEDFSISTNVEDGNYITITGRSLESILERRVVWKQTILTGNLQNGIKKLLTENVISPTDSNRKINNFIFENSTDENITNLTLEAQFRGENLYDVISSICEAFSIGFKITLNSNNKFVFKLYSGKDRSYDQTENPYVVFSPNFENIVNSNYIQSKKTLKTVSLVLGEGEGAKRKYTSVEIDSGGGSGLDRREMCTDARDISTYVEDSEEPMPDREYKAQLAQRGKEELAENTYTQSFEGQVETTKMFVYERDFFMGDIVHILNEYGLEKKVRISEVVRSQNTEGYNVYPTFSAVY